VYILPFQTHFQGFFNIKIPVFYPECQRFAFLVSKTIRFFTLTQKFVSFRFGFDISLKFLNEIGLILLLLKAM
jgi:hypothetical protein